MAVDLNGYIVLPECTEFQPAFSPVVAQVVTRLSLCFPDLIHSLYIYGSVAECRAILNKSDLDITLIFNYLPDQLTSVKLAEVQRELEKSHPIISKIDFDCGLLQQVEHPDNLLSWGYWLRHHCVCVYGNDLSQRFTAFKPSKAIAVAVNGDFLSVLEALFAQIQITADENKKLQLQRAAARKIIRATSILRREQDTDWPDTLSEHCNKFNHRYPDLAEDMNYLLAISYEPQGDMAHFNNRVMVFARWLNTEFNHQH